MDTVNNNDGEGKVEVIDPTLFKTSYIVRDDMRVGGEKKKVERFSFSFLVQSQSDLTKDDAEIYCAQVRIMVGAFARNFKTRNGLLEGIASVPGCFVEDGILTVNAVEFKNRPTNRTGGTGIKEADVLDSFRALYKAHEAMRPAILAQVASIPRFSKIATDELHSLLMQ